MGLHRRSLVAMRVVGLISAFLHSNLLFAEEACDPIDLRSPGESAEGLDFMAQGHTNLCSQYSASLLIDAWRQKTYGRRLSAEERTIPTALAVDLAISRRIPIWFPIQNTTDPLTDIPLRWGGIACPLVRQSRAYKSCLASSLENPVADLQSPDLPNKSYDLYNIAYRYARLKKKNRAAQLDAVTDQIRNLLETKLPKPRRTWLREEIRDAVQTYARKPYKLVKHLLFETCSSPENLAQNKRIPVCHTEVLLTLSQFGLGKKQDFLKAGLGLRRIHALLGRNGALPIPFAYCANVLSEGYAYQNRSILAGRCRAHWSAIIGRKKIDGKCHLLVRNSWEPEGESARAIVWPKDAPNDVWVEDETLYRSMAAFSYLR